jgi:hypothetical protein
LRYSLQNLTDPIVIDFLSSVPAEHRRFLFEKDANGLIPLQTIVNSFFYRYLVDPPDTPHGIDGVSKENCVSLRREFEEKMSSIDFAQLEEIAATGQFPSNIVIPEGFDRKTIDTIFNHFLAETQFSAAFNYWSLLLFCKRPAECHSLESLLETLQTAATTQQHQPTVKQLLAFFEQYPLADSTSAEELPPPSPSHPRPSPAFRQSHGPAILLDHWRFIDHTNTQLFVYNSANDNPPPNYFLHRRKYWATALWTILNEDQFLQFGKAEMVNLFERGIRCLTEETNDPKLRQFLTAGVTSMIFEKVLKSSEAVMDTEEGKEDKSASSLSRSLIAARKAKGGLTSGTQELIHELLLRVIATTLTFRDHFQEQFVAQQVAPSSSIEQTIIVRLLRVYQPITLMTIPTYRKLLNTLLPNDCPTKTEITEYLRGFVSPPSLESMKATTTATLPTDSLDTSSVDSIYFNLFYQKHLSRPAAGKSEAGATTDSPSLYDHPVVRNFIEQFLPVFLGWFPEMEFHANMDKEEVSAESNLNIVRTIRGEEFKNINTLAQLREQLTSVRLYLEWVEWKCKADKNLTETELVEAIKTFIGNLPKPAGIVEYHKAMAKLLYVYSFFLGYESYQSLFFSFLSQENYDHLQKLLLQVCPTREEKLLFLYAIGVNDLGKTRDVIEFIDNCNEISPTDKHPLLIDHDRRLFLAFKHNFSGLKGFHSGLFSDSLKELFLVGLSTGFNSPQLYQGENTPLCVQKFISLPPAAKLFRLVIQIVDFGGAKAEVSVNSLLLTDSRYELAVFGVYTLLTEKERVYSSFLQRSFKEEVDQVLQENEISQTGSLPFFYGKIAALCRLIDHNVEEVRAIHEAWTHLKNTRQTRKLHEILERNFSEQLEIEEGNSNKSPILLYFAPGFTRNLIDKTTTDGRSLTHGIFYALQLLAQVYQQSEMKVQHAAEEKDREIQRLEETPKNERDSPWAVQLENKKGEKEIHERFRDQQKVIIINCRNILAPLNSKDPPFNLTSYLEARDILPQWDSGREKKTGKITTQSDSPATVASSFPDEVEIQQYIVSHMEINSMNPQSSTTSSRLISLPSPL